LGQKRSGLRSPLSAHLDIFIQKECDQFIGHALRQIGAPMLKGHFEGDGGALTRLHVGIHQFHADTATHLVHSLRRGKT